MTASSSCGSLSTLCGFRKRKNNGERMVFGNRVDVLEAIEAGILGRKDAKSPVQMMAPTKEGVEVDGRSDKERK
ncbi:hypothetical protein BBBOND_0204250 [Babesia bigemina]|uniref:Uncharacterized protein n=1 Tax=Babesia bigemina TaxID=5866 RepID=A0A061D5F7_BABBI|nr:hypothetical protein BBBOND_0204250 [Babesia bigemina]CDR95267.1 hypothetical protein BBBOND_0204250 [Babesia bigemina]|eukprot:XP_012767453.1 hypothetical protein BBBOND_0204250 [Babesia bigemina]